MASALLSDAFLACGPAADLAFAEVMISSRAVLSAEEDDLQMPSIPGFFGENHLQVALGLNYRAAIGQSPPGC